ncbi:hypothetical protein BDW02DRAFT_597498 [Decorospora gaudefroyi]|uniref:Uncharacterized protein n=1 Tax=Decorospora gaudefroyi TaxID=184978 RepID=A0A6A5KGF5_9PLEO|nr:hypothetical protein BDW02DRAFT_597498 [Decorospora gaudefroyi]
MSSPTQPPTKPSLTLSLSLPLSKPTLQRAYTTSPSHQRACTPRTSHGFIPLHTATPDHVSPQEETNDAASTSTRDYFSIRRTDMVLPSPNPAPYEAHGFLPLCSVSAAVGVCAEDYFSVGACGDGTGATACRDVAVLEEDGQSPTAKASFAPHMDDAGT